MKRCCVHAADTRYATHLHNSCNLQINRGLLMNYVISWNCPLFRTVLGLCKQISCQTANLLKYTLYMKHGFAELPPPRRAKLLFPCPFFE